MQIGISDNNITPARDGRNSCQWLSLLLLLFLLFIQCQLHEANGRNSAFTSIVGGLCNVEKKKIIVGKSLNKKGGNRNKKYINGNAQ